MVEGARAHRSARVGGRGWCARRDRGDGGHVRSVCRARREVVVRGLCGESGEAVRLR